MSTPIKHPVLLVACVANQLIWYQVQVVYFGKRYRDYPFTVYYSTTF